MARKQLKLSGQIRQAIADSGKTRYEIAKSTGLNESALCQFFLGKRGLSIQSLDVLAEFLDLEVVRRASNSKKRR